MRLNHALLAALAAPLIAAACLNPGEPSARPALTVTNLVPGNLSVLLLEFEFHNTTPRPLYLLECGGNVFTSVSVKEPSGRVDTWSTICLGIWLVNRIPIPSGARYRATTTVAVRRGGTYLLMVQYLTDSTVADPELVRAPAFRFQSST
jgi:hypothetical protein